MIEARIKELRKELRLTQAGFGERLGVSRDVIGNIEYGRVVPKDVFLNHVCSIYNVNKEWLVEGKGEVFLEAEGAFGKNAEEALKAFRLLDEIYQNYVLQQMKALLKIQNEYR